MFFFVSDLPNKKVYLSEYSQSIVSAIETNTYNIPAHLIGPGTQHSHHI